MGKPSVFKRAVWNLVNLRFSFVPFWMYLIIGYVVIVATAIPFLIGYQYTPYDNGYDLNSTDPECQLFGKVEAGLTDRNVDIIYTTKNRFEISRQMSWRLLRLFVNGSFVHEEVRSSAEMGLFAMDDKMVARFELQHEGNVSVDLYCLDKKFARLNFTIDPSTNNSEYSVFHENGDVTNMCVHRAERFVFGRVTHRNLTEEFDKAVSAVFIQTPIAKYMENNSKIERVTGQGLVDMNMCSSSYDLVSRVLPWIHWLSKHELDISFNRNDDKWPEFDRVILNLTGKTPIETMNNPYSWFCWYNSRAASISYDFNKSDLTEIKERFVGANAAAEDVIIYNERHVSEIGPDNEEDIKLLLAKRGDIHSSRLSEMSLSEKLEIFKKAKLLVSDDDNNEIVHAVWMPPNATVVLLKDPDQVKMSSAYDFLVKMGIRVVVLKGSRMDADGGNSREEEQEEFMSTSLSELQYTVSLEKLNDLLDTL